MKISIVRDLAPPLYEEMVGLYRKIPRSAQTAFNNPSFLRVCWEHYKADAEPFGVVARRGGELVGAAFFRISRVTMAGRKRRAIVPIGDVATDFTSFLVGTDERSAFLRSLLGEFAATDGTVVLPALREEDYCDPGWAESAPENGWVCYEEITNPIAIEGETSLEKMSRKQSIRNLTNRLGRMGEVTVEHYSSEVPTGTVEEFFTLHRERWAFDRTPSKFSRASVAELYRRLCEENAAGAVNGSGVVLSAMRLAGEPVAMHLGFRWADTLLYQVPVINVAFLDSSPGQVLMGALLRYAAEEGIRCFDLGNGGESYKDRFSTETHMYRTYVRPASRLDRVRFRVRDKLSGDKGVGSAARKSAAEGLDRAKRAARAARRALRSRRVLVFGVAGGGAPEADIEELDFPAFVQATRSSPSFPYRLERRYYERFRAGYRLFALREGGERVSFAWMAAKPEQLVGEAWTVLRSREEARWIVDCATPPEYRGRGYYPRLLTALRALDDSEVLIYTLADNTASRRGIEKAQFTLRAELIYRAGRAALRPATAAGAEFSLHPMARTGS